MNDYEQNFIENWPGYEEMIHQLDRMNELNYDDLCELENTLIELQKVIINDNILLALFNPLSEDIEDVALRKSIIEMESFKEAESFYLDLLDIDSNESVNGFNLYDCDYNLVDYTEFKSLKNMWIENVKISDDDMREWINNLSWLKISWSLINKNGVIMHHDKSLVEALKQNVQALIDLPYLNNNIEAILSLPYPREVIKNSIIIGGDTPYDSPRYCNFFCEWMKRKIMNKFMYNEVVDYIQKIKVMSNKKITNKYLLAEIVELKYGHMYTFYQIMNFL